MVKLLKQWGFPAVLFLIPFFIPLDEDKFSFGELITIRIIAGLGFALAGHVAQMTIQFIAVTLIKRNIGFLEEEKRHLSIILMLAAKIVKADGKVDANELRLIRKRISNEFNTEDTKRYLKEFESYLELEISIKELGKVIAYDFDDSAKYQLMYLLIRLATVDGLLSDSELHVIRDIAKYGRIKSSSYQHILKAFDFRREQTYQKKSQQGAKSKSRANTKILRKAYELLGVSANATMDEIKKAYYKLAKIHHPDKFAYLGSEHQKSAKIKFQDIGDAYDIIKEKKGFK